MVDSFVIAAPLFLIAVVALLGFVGCSFHANVLASSVKFKFRQLIAQDDKSQALTDTIEATFADVDQQGNPSGSVATGDLVIVWIWYNSATEVVTKVIDSEFNQYFPAVGPTTGSGNLAGWRQELFYAVIAKGAPHLSVTATFSKSFTGEKALVPHAYVGDENLSVDNVVRDDQTGNTTTAPPKAGPGSSATGSLVFGAALFNTNGGAAADFHQRADVSGNVTEEKQDSGGGGTLDVEFTAAANVDWIVQMLAFF
jgi:hypothetical protein